MEGKDSKNKKPIFIIVPKDRKIAVGEYTYSSDPAIIKTVIVRPKNKLSNIEKSVLSNDRFSLVNFITQLMERNHIEKALELINIYFGRLTNLEQLLLSLNIIEATKEYEIPSNYLPDSYYDFMASDESNALFNLA